MPSQTTIPTKIPTKTPKNTKTPIQTPTPKGFLLGNITYQIPTTGREWCWSREIDKEYGLTHVLISFCQFNNDPTTIIDIVHLKEANKSNREAIESILSVYQDWGIEILNVDFIDEIFITPIGPGEAALVSMNFPSEEIENPVIEILFSIPAESEYYIIKGKISKNMEAYDFFMDSVFEIFDSLELVN